MTTPTVNVQFGGDSGSDPFFRIWLDKSLNLDADGNVLSNFYQVDQAWFLLQLEPGYVPDKIFTSYGMVSGHDQVRRAVTQDGVVWSYDEPSVELECYPTGSVNVDWIGESIKLAAVSGRTLAAAVSPLEAIARANLSYNTQAWLYCWHPPTGLVLEDEQEYPAEIQITVKEVV